MKNIFLDANVVVRFVTKDPVAQAEQSKELFIHIQEGKYRAYVSTLVLHEIVYILIHYYQLPKEKVVNTLNKLLEIEQIMVFDLEKNRVKKTFKQFAKMKVDLPDCFYAQLIDQENFQIATFDKDFRRLGVISLMKNL